MVYAATMLARGYASPGSPGSAQERVWKQRNLVKLTAVPSVKTLWVNRNVAETFNALNLVLQHHGAKLGENVDDWGFANRSIRDSGGGASNDSYHRWALALDDDATENRQHTSTTSFPVHITDEACKLLGLTWGLHFNPPWQDPMHFEDHLTRLRRRWLASRLLVPTKRSRRLAALAQMSVQEFCRRVKSFERYA